jgi:hypothetical protein
VPEPSSDGGRPGLQRARGPAETLVVASPDDLKLTPEERRTLVAFFHRQVLPYLGGIAGMALLGIVIVVAATPDTIRVEPILSAAALQRMEAVEPTSDEPAPPGADGLAAESEALRAELAALRVELEQKLGAATQGIDQLGRRVDVTTKDLASLGQKLEANPPAAARAAAKPGPGATSGDLETALERLHDLEVRQGQLDVARQAFEKDVLVRLYAVEKGREEVSRARLAEQESLRSRLVDLEERLFGVEKGLAGKPER